MSKILLLALAAGCSIAAMSIGYETVLNDEIDSEVATIKAKGRRELLLEGVKHRLAMASKSQRLLFLNEMKALMEEFGSAEDETMTADEINALYADTNQVQPEGRVEEIESFRNQFPESMDATSWKACLKAMGDGAGREEIIKDVLGGGEAAGKYFDFLRGKYP